MMSPDQFAKRLETLSERLEPAKLGAMTEAALYVQGEVQRTIRAMFPSGRTGQLWRSFHPEFYQSQNGRVFGARVVSDLVYAGILNRGGTVYPRRARALAVPIGQGKLLPIGLSARDVPGLTFIPRKGKPPLLVRERGKRVELMFVLKSSVTIRPRRYLEVAWVRSREQVAKILGDKYGAGITEEW